MWESRSARLEAQTSDPLTPHPAALRSRSRLQRDTQPSGVKCRPASRCFCYTKVGEEAAGQTGASPEARLLDAPQESKLSLWGGQGPGVKSLMKRIPTQVPSQERISTSGCKGGGRHGPPPAVAFTAFILATWGPRARCSHVSPNGSEERRSEGARQDTRKNSPCRPSLAQAS